MSRTREDILWDIEHYTQRAEINTEWADKYIKWAEECTEKAEFSTKKVNKAKQELKAFDEANK